jgi:membrane protease YdiL (CAAX protease family)
MMIFPKYQPRRVVPWGLLELLFAATLFLSAHETAMWLAETMVGPPTRPAVESKNADQSDTRHPTLQLFDQGGTAIVLLCVLTAVVVAPLSEEFFFRVLFQGWLEKVEGHMRRRWPGTRRMFPRAWGPILISSLFFAAMHIRGPSPPPEVGFMTWALAGDALGRVMAVLAVVALFIVFSGARAFDFGFQPRTLWPDVRLGLKVFAVIAVPIYALQIASQYLVDKLSLGIVADPFTLFPFALVLGTLYWRTHRLAPIVTLHVALNGTSLLLTWLSSLAAGGGG